MRFDISFGDKRPLGHVFKPKAVGEETVQVQSIEFTSTEDGQHFIQRVEGYPQQVLDLIRQQHGELIMPPIVHSMIVVIRHELLATAYINEGFGSTSMRSTGAMDRGQEVSKNDIADFEHVNLEVEIPSDAGVMFLFSLGWRKGYYYDFWPLNPKAPEPRQYDCKALLAELFAYVFFLERFSITDDEWQKLYAARLFLFAGMKNETIDVVVSHVKAGWDLNSLNERISDEVSGRLASFAQSWRDHHIIRKHMPLLDRAVERFEAGDYISAASILMPQIEGMLRSNHSIVGDGNPNQGNLTKSAVARKIHRSQSLLLPDRFRDYLKTVYFADFKNLLPGDPGAPMSRHTVAHGIAGDGQFDRFTTAICLLTVHQLFYFFDKLEIDPDGNSPR